MTLSIGLGTFIVVIVFSALIGAMLVGWASWVLLPWFFRKSLAKPEGLASFLQTFAVSREERRARGEQLCPVTCPCNGRGWL